MRYACGHGRRRPYPAPDCARHHRREAARRVLPRAARVRLPAREADSWRSSRSTTCRGRPGRSRAFPNSCTSTSPSRTGTFWTACMHARSDWAPGFCATTSTIPWSRYTSTPTRTVIRSACSWHRPEAYRPGMGHLPTVLRWLLMVTAVVWPALELRHSQRLRPGSRSSTRRRRMSPTAIRGHSRHQVSFVLQERGLRRKRLSGSTPGMRAPTALESLIQIFGRGVLGDSVAGPAPTRACVGMGIAHSTTPETD